MRILTVSAALCALAGSAGAQRGGFVTRLGNDTIAVERFTRTPDSLVGEMVTRSPTTQRFSYVAHLDKNGAVTTYTAILYKGFMPGTAVAVRADVDFRGGDTIRLTSWRSNHTDHVATAYAAGAVPILEPSMGQYEIVVRQAIAANGARIPFAGYYIGAGDIYPGSAIRSAPDLVLIATPTDTVRARIDPDGRIVGLTDPGGTLQATVTRIPWPDLDRWTVHFVNIDMQGKSLGSLSPRDTVRETVAGTHVMVDYGRPSKRGRVIFGGVVPYNTVWRTGANAATTLVIDKDIMLGGAKVPAGEYTLFSLATPDSWTLIVSKKTKEWGTDYDSTADFARIPMAVGVGKPLEQFTIRVEPEASEHVLSFQWDTRVGQIGITQPIDDRASH